MGWFEKKLDNLRDSAQQEIDIILKSKIDFNEALENYAKIILLYVQNLHENTDARIIGLYSNVYDYNAEDDFSSLIDPWTLKGKPSVESFFHQQLKFLMGNLDERLYLVIVSPSGPRNSNNLRVVFEFNMHYKDNQGNISNLLPLTQFSDVAKVFFNK